MFLWTNICPGPKRIIRLGGTRESEHPNHKIYADPVYIHITVMTKRAYPRPLASRYFSNTSFEEEIWLVAGHVLRPFDIVSEILFHLGV